MPQSQELTSAPHFRVVASQPKAELLIVHGLAEYAHRYRSIAEQFAAHGISTFAFDQRGHGNAPGVRMHIDRFEDLVADAAIVCRALAAESSGRPLFVWGHSMGAIVALLVAARTPTLAGLIVTSNSLNVFKRGTKPSSPFFRIAALVAPQVRIRLGLDSRKISRDESVQHAYARDPLIPPTASLRLIVEFAKACEQAFAVASRISMPTLVVHGGCDAIAPASGSEVLMERLASGDKTLKIFPDALHEVHNEREPERSQFAELVARWLLAHAKNGFSVLPLPRATGEG